MWDESQTKNSTNRASPHIVENHIVYGINKFYIDGEWREQDSCTGQGWVYKNGGSSNTMMGAMSIRKSLSPLHDECEAFDMGDEVHEDPTNLRGGVCN